jgi:nucleoside-diphosphate kinase
MTEIVAQRFIYVPKPNIETSFFMIKPDASLRGLVDVLRDRIEQKGIIITEMQMGWLTEEILFELYKHVRKNYREVFDEMLPYMLSAPVYPMIVEGKDVITNMRGIVGPTYANDIKPGTLRDLRIPAEQGGMNWKNLLHASDSSEKAKKESELIFNNFIYEKTLIHR